MAMIKSCGNAPSTTTKKEAAKPTNGLDALETVTTLDGHVKKHLGLLEAIGASGVTRGDSTDVAAGCFDELSLSLYKKFGRSASAACAVDRALALERAEHTRERLLRNRLLMA